jgi:hypothetical protein
MRALLLVVALAVTGVAHAEGPELRVHVGGQVGLPFVVGVTSITSFLHEGRARFDVDATWEPSLQLQSYSLGGAYHVLDSVFFVGGRLRLVQTQPSWARGGGDAFFGMGLELGARIRVGPGDHGLITIALGGTFLPGQATNLTTFVGLNLGFSWAVFER